MIDPAGKGITSAVSFSTDRERINPLTAIAPGCSATAFIADLRGAGNRKRDGDKGLFRIGR